MLELHISLLREKFVIHDPKRSGEKRGKAVTALSNRIELELVNEAGKTAETFIIRTQNMHSCVRLAAKILQSFNQSGVLLTRNPPYDWAATWKSVVNDYEKDFNPARWVCVYHDGHPVFADGERHPLLDVIEKCENNNSGQYEDTILIAEDAFKKTGKTVKIEYDGNDALVVNLERERGRCGIILRGASRTTTFNFSATAKKDQALNFAQILFGAAAYLEGIQLAFQIGMDNVKIQRGIIERHSPEEKKNREAKRRLVRLGTDIGNMEGAFAVRYRPQKPEFHDILIEAEKLAHGVLMPPEER